jgi:hypothetical protein
MIITHLYHTHRVIIAITAAVVRCPILLPLPLVHKGRSLIMVRLISFSLSSLYVYVLLLPSRFFFVIMQEKKVLAPTSSFHLI